MPAGQWWQCRRDRGCLLAVLEGQLQGRAADSSLGASLQPGTSLLRVSAVSQEQLQSRGQVVAVEERPAGEAASGINPKGWAASCRARRQQLSVYKTQMRSRQAAGSSPQRDQPPSGSCLLGELAGACQIKEAVGRWQAVHLAAPLLVSLEPGGRSKPCFKAARLAARGGATGLVCLLPVPLERCICTTRRWSQSQGWQPRAAKGLWNASYHQGATWARAAACTLAAGWAFMPGWWPTGSHDRPPAAPKSPWSSPDRALWP